MTTAVDRPKCGAKTRAGGPCQMPAGLRTAHPGVDRCWLHGGRKADGTDKRVKSGRYSKTMSSSLGELAEKHLANLDPLNLMPELAMLRALLENYLARTTDVDKIDVGPAAGMIDTISKIVSRIETARAANAIGRPELYRVIMQIIRIIDANVPDPAARERIVTELNAIAF